MPVSFNDSISWRSPSADDAAMLNDLQPNIIKGHVREFLSILFLRFDYASSGRDFLQELSSTLMKSAMDHLQEVDAFKTSGTPGTPYVGVGLTADGYDFLEVADIPPDPSFQAGMQADAALNDPDIATWDPCFSETIHAIVLVGDQFNAEKADRLQQINDLIADIGGITVVGHQDGRGLHNDNKEGIEHFGYVDGRSQPLFLKEDIENEMNTTDGISNWSPDFPLAQVIVSDIAAPDPSLSCGSYFIYRKLEQNVRLFKTQEGELADALPIPDEERAGAMLVGRFEDGTPVTMQFDDGIESPVPNSFNYNSDLLGAKCPFAGHIRKTNPRGTGGFEPVEQERQHIMARRGQTYGVRTDNPNDGMIDNKPEQDVGLLFMAFNSDIAQQFEFTQGVWANNPGFPRVPAGSPSPGVDPVIGQTPGDSARPDISCPVTWGDSLSITTVPNVPRAVTMKGGAYFFMPSLSFLRSLGGQAAA